jgi:hypothetical protein
MPVSWRISEEIVWLESAEPVTFEEWKAAIDGALRGPARDSQVGSVGR